MSVYDEILNLRQRMGDSIIGLDHIFINIPVWG